MNVKTRLDRIERKTNDIPLNGIFQREPRDFAEMALWVRAGYGWVEPVKSRWAELAHYALTDPATGEIANAADD